MIKELLSYIPKHNIYGEVFGGSGSLLFAKQKARLEYYNDLNRLAVNFFFCLKHKKDELLEAMSCLYKSPEEFLKHKSLIEKHYQDTGMVQLGNIQIAVSFFYANRFSVNAKGGYWKKKDNKLVYNENILRASSKRLATVNIYFMDFVNFISQIDDKDTFFYCDPPYYKVQGANDYIHRFDLKDHTRLRDVLSTIKGKFLLSYNDHPDLHALYNNYVVETIQHTYTASGKNQEVKELLIYNYAVPKQLELSFGLGATTSSEHIP